MFGQNYSQTTSEHWLFDYMDLATKQGEEEEREMKLQPLHSFSFKF